MRPNSKSDAEFYRKVNQQLHSKDRMIKSLQQRLTEMQARVGGRAVDPAGNEVEMELAELEAALMLTSPADPPSAPAPVHPEHDSAMAMMVGEVPLPAVAPHVPSPLPEEPVATVPKVTEAPVDRMAAKIAAVRAHLTDASMDDAEIMATALKLLGWYLKRQAAGMRVQLVNEAGATTEVDLIL